MAPREMCMAPNEMLLAPQEVVRLPRYVHCLVEMCDAYVTSVGNFRGWVYSSLVIQLNIQSQEISFLL
jgi:hypothetical protein